MRLLWFYIVCWKHRNDCRFEFFEQYTLVLKAARRCAYDLTHCAGDLSLELSRNNEKSIVDYHKRSQMWQDIFSPTGGKDYRHDLHYDIDKAEREVTRLQELCTKNGIDYYDPNGIPF